MSERQEFYDNIPESLNADVPRHDSWTAQSFRITQNGFEAKTVDGETWRHFGIAEFAGEQLPCLSLTHLTTGCRLWIGDPKETKWSELKVLAEALGDLIPDSRVACEVEENAAIARIVITEMMEGHQ